MTLLEEQIAQVQAAMTALEGQRSILGDAVVESALAALRANLAALQSQGRQEQQRKQVTALFADVFGFTALAETKDAEVVTEVMNNLWALVDRAITEGGGHIDKHIGDAVMALWGVDAAREDDAERAVRAALAMQAAVNTFCQSHNIPVAMRVGINTGPALLGQVGTTAEFTAIGDTVNLASRLEQACPVGAVLIAHDTYRHVRGIFDVQAQEPLVIKGKSEPVRTYVVLRAKARALRLPTRGVEGIETPMVGRDGELARLQAAYSAAMADARTQTATVIGEAGVGKSRLLYEFSNWLELRPEHIRYFKGRATPNTRNVPYSLFRDLFALRFDILDSDSAAVARDKFRGGMAGLLEPEQADVVGHWLGFDFSASPAVSGLLGGGNLGTVARAHLLRYLRALAAAPAVIILEDIHWADEQSLELAAHVRTAVPDGRLLLLALARPSLFERRSAWDRAHAASGQITLTPLSEDASGALVDEILRQVDNVPDTLRDLIITTAEGNPFYLEELIKMLIDEGVIERGIRNYELGIGDGEQGIMGSPQTTDPLNTDHWTVRADKLAGLKIPATLTALLQARLDGLPLPERTTLQRAAIVGRLFWDDPVAELLDTPRHLLDATLESVRKRELIFRRERSAFAEAEEYIFKHALLRDVAYETVLLKYRAEFHGRVARWLEEHAGERIDEYLGLIAEHFVQAGETDRAAEYQHRSGAQALRLSAFRAARTAFERALALREQSGAPPAATLPHYLQLGVACVRLSDYPAGEQALARALEVARVAGDQPAQAEALSWLSVVALSVGRVDDAEQLLAEALVLARPLGGATLARVLIHVTNHEWQGGKLDEAAQHAEEVRRLAQQLGDVSQEIAATRALGVVSGLRREFDESRRYFETCLGLARQIGDRFQESSSESNLGATKQYAGDFAGAVVHYLAAFEADEELGMISRMALNAHNLADAYATLGQLDESRRYAVECVRLAGQIGAVPLQLAALVPLAEVLVKQGQPDRALTLLGLARHHPSTPKQKEVGINELLAVIQLTPEQIEAGLAAGAQLELAAVVAEVLAGQW